MATYTVIDATTGGVVHEEELPDSPPDPNAIDIAALKATVSKATTVTALRGAMMAYLDAAADQQP